MATTGVTDATDTAGTAGAAARKVTTGVAGRMAALGRAELTLLVRNRYALFVALLMPLLMVGVIRSSVAGVGLEGTGMSVAEASLSGGIVMALLLVVYLNPVSAYVARREELVLKRLRTGEVSDREILAGTALPAGVLGVAQSVLMVVAGVAFLDVRAPERPELLVGGVLLGLVLLVTLAAVTAGLTRTVESAQITTMPLFVVSSAGSGLFVPLEVFPEKMASLCELLPLTGVMTLVRAGWLGGIEPGEAVGAVTTTLAWTVISVFAVQRWFRWEPRR